MLFNIRQQDASPAPQLTEFHIPFKTDGLQKDAESQLSY